MNRLNVRQSRTLRRFSVAAGGVYCLAIIGACLLAAGGAALALPPQIDIPEHWGTGSAVTKASPRPAAVAPSPLPREQDLMLIPKGRLIVGSGTVDPRHYLLERGALASTYVLQAPEPAVVEYTYPKGGLFTAGFPLMRLYDIGILPDLRKAEAAVRDYLEQPFTILQPARSVRDFPSPTASRPLLNLLPAPEPAPEPAAPLRQGGLARNSSPSSGLSIERKQAGNQTTTVAEAQGKLDELAAQFVAVREQLVTLHADKNRLEGQIAEAQAKLQQAEQDLCAREALYDQGVLAADNLEPARKTCRQLEARVASLQERRPDTEGRIASTRARADDLQAQLKSATAAVESARQQAKSRPSRVAAPERATTPKPQPAKAARAARTQPTHKPEFPKPTAGDRAVPDRSRLAALADDIRGLAAHEREHSAQRRVALPPVPEALTRLGEPRWQTVTAPTGGVVVEEFVPNGGQAAAGQPLLRIANSRWARVYADLSPQYLGEYRQGSPVAIVFDEYPDARFEGWINSITPTADGLALRAEIYAVCTAGYFGSDAYATLQWLAGAAPVAARHSDTELGPAVETVPETYTGHYSIYSLVPIVPAEFGPALDTAERTVHGEYVGYMRVAKLDAEAREPSDASEKLKERVKKLAEWRKTFTEGMTTTVFPNGLVLTYPANGESKRAVEKMATGQVSHVANRCARTMAEALGWGLGDAAYWAHGLPGKGYKLREDGLARPGDILVWPFTYGPRRNQHVGIAVLQGGRMMTLSNSVGRLGTDEILPGYLAFYQPTPVTPETTTRID